MSPTHSDNRRMVVFKDPITVPYLSDQNIRFSMANGVVKAPPPDFPSDIASSRGNTHDSLPGCVVHPHKTRVRLLKLFDREIVLSYVPR